MIKDQDFLKDKAAYCLDLAKKIGATDASVKIGHSISETVNFRNKNLDESNRSDGLAFSIDTYIGKKKSSISSSNLSDENLTIANIVIDLGHKLGMKVIAEGVETEEQVKFLKKYACDKIQGYIISEPINEIEFNLLL